MAKKAFIGIDLHKNNFTACFIRKGEEVEHQIYEFDSDGIKEFQGKLNKKDELAVEAVSNVKYFTEAIQKYVKKVTVVAPGQFYVISNSIKKTDKNDAEALAFYLSKDMLPKARIKAKVYYDISSLIDTRNLLANSKSSLTNRTHSILMRHGVIVPKRRLQGKNAYDKYVMCYDWNEITRLELELIKEQVKHYNESIDLLEKRIEESAKTLKGYDNIISITGIGPLTAAILLTVIGDIDDFESASKLASYFGIVPKVSQSNETDKIRRITKRGSKIGRTTLVTCMFVACQHNAYLKNHFERIKSKRGGGRAMIATARKYLNIIFNTLKNDWIFEDFPNYKYYQRNKTE